MIAQDITFLVRFSISWNRKNIYTEAYLKDLEVDRGVFRTLAIIYDGVFLWK